MRTCESAAEIPRSLESAETSSLDMSDVENTAAVTSGLEAAASDG